MITKIVAQLKTGSIKKVIPYGKPIPTPPYIVVKEFTHPMGNGYFIIVHFNQGQQILLDDYIKKDIPTLLNNFKATTRNGNLQELQSDIFEPIPELQVQNDDDTISKERVYWMPDKLN
jgi:hypothetical protein